MTEIDREALRRRYRFERDKRLRPDGNRQYLEPTGRYAHFLDDPYTEVGERPPRFDEVTVAVVGAGFAGLCTAARLKQAGVDGVRLVDSGGDVGGAWYWNRYPGAMCDTAAMIYLPMLEETGRIPSQKYVAAPEIHAQARAIATTFGLYDDALFSTSVTRLEWNDDTSRWTVHTDRGDAFRARFVATGTGPLHRPKLPGIDGIERFEGHAFHTSRWDYAYTGGSPSGAPMTGLADKRVGIIGTGATAVQCIPHLARAAHELFVFQRTPSSVDVRDNQPLDPRWFASLDPGWQREWLMNFATLQTGGFADVDLVEDGWTDISKRIRDRVVAMLGEPGNELGPDLMRRAYEDSDDEKMEEIRARCETVVDDPATAEALKPWYRQLCKRPCFHDEYLAAFNEPGCQLVDTDGRGVELIDATGAWANGEHTELDCMIFASGFEFGTDHARRAGFETVGRNGETLSEHWADGMRTLHGYHVRGFPNMFVIGMSQAANLISNVTHNLTEAATTIAQVIRHTIDVGADQVECGEAAERAWVHAIEHSPRSSFLGNPECTPGYYNNEGAPIGRRERLDMGGYPDGPVAFFEMIARWRDEGTYHGLEVR